jgi:hypothetical protein
MLGFGRTVFPTNYVKVWAHGFAQQKGRTKGREYLVSWWCSSPAKVASGEVGQQRRSRGHRGWGGRRAGAGREDAGPQVVLDRAQSPLRVAARRADGGDRPRARRVQAAGGRAKVRKSARR